VCGVWCVVCSVWSVACGVFGFLRPYLECITLIPFRNATATNAPLLSLLQTSNPKSRYKQFLRLKALIRCM
jgi:hypothetical protein